MDQLFAPWRIDWVRREHPPTEDCVFCVLPDRKTDRETLIVARSESSYVLLNNHPYNPGHVMIIPRRHTEDLRGLSDAELLDQAMLTQVTLTALETAMDPDGFNTGTNLGRAGGGSIDHVHTHVVPRWESDANFMAVVDDTRVIVQALEDTYDELHAAFGEMDGARTSGEDHAVEICLETTSRDR